jgi:hypothetical protein
MTHIPQERVRGPRASEWVIPEQANNIARPGSLLPVPHLQPGDGVVCDFCGRKAYLTAPPPEGFRDPWRGSTMAKVTPHWSNPMKEAAREN